MSDPQNSHVIDDADIVPNSCDEDSIDAEPMYSIDIQDNTDYCTPDNSDDNIEVHNEIDHLIHDMSFEEDIPSGGQSDSDTQLSEMEYSQHEHVIDDVNSSILDSSISTENVDNLSLNPGSEPDLTGNLTPLGSQRDPENENVIAHGSDDENGIAHGSDDENGIAAGSDDENGIAAGSDDENGLDLATDVDNMYCRQEEALDPLLNPLLVSEITWRDSDFEPTHVHGFTGSGDVHLPNGFNTSDATALHYWKLFVTDETVAKIVQNTNRYFDYNSSQKRITRPHYVDKNWYSFSEQECRAFWGMSMVMGVSGVKRYRYIWSSNPYLRNNGLASVMTLNRYAKISEYFHVSDRESEVAPGLRGYDKLGKIRWFIDEIHSKFKELKSPDKNQAIDESIIKFSGRAEYKQWNAAKPIRNGLKVFARTDSVSGFVHIAQLYLGARNTKKSKDGFVF